MCAHGGSKPHCSRHRSSTNNASRHIGALRHPALACADGVGNAGAGAVGDGGGGCRHAGAFLHAGVPVVVFSGKRGGVERIPSRAS
jgi:hypothetical protein